MPSFAVLLDCWECAVTACEARLSLPGVLAGNHSTLVEADGKTWASMYGHLSGSFPLIEMRQCHEALASLPTSVVCHVASHYVDVILGFSDMRNGSTSCQDISIQESIIKMSGSEPCPFALCSDFLSPGYRDQVYKHFQTLPFAKSPSGNRMIHIAS